MILSVQCIQNADIIVKVFCIEQKRVYIVLLLQLGLVWLWLGLVIGKSIYIVPFYYTCILSKHSDMDHTVSAVVSSLAVNDVRVSVSQGKCA